MTDLHENMTVAGQVVGGRSLFNDYCVLGITFVLDVALATLTLLILPKAVLLGALPFALL